MKKFKNTRKEAFLNNIPCVSIDDIKNDLTKRCKFNFSYMDFSQSAGQKFEDWSHEQLAKLLNKLHNYSKESLKRWKNQKIGSKKQNVLEVYEKFPNHSDFIRPKHVPHQAFWARFRLESSVRLIGFVLPDNYHKKEHKGTKELFDCNTFYVVFLDANHRFYKTKK